MPTNLEDKIEIVPYNSAWIKQAQDEIAVLKNIFQNETWIKDIQHIGSTAVPGLAAKPIVDIYIGVESISQAQKAIDPLKELGYQFWAENPNKEKMFFVKGMPPFGTGRTHHVHIVNYDSRYWRAQILFRDYLRDHPSEVALYAKLKVTLMEKYPLDREAYTDAKTDFIASVLQKAGFQELVKR